MEEKKGPVSFSSGRKIGYTLTPAVVFVLCSIIGSVLIARVLIACGLREDAVFPGGFPGGKVSAALLASLAASVLTILVQQIFRKRDAQILEKERRRWPAAEIFLGILTVTGAGVLENMLLSFSRLQEILPSFRIAETVSYSGQNPVLLFLAVAVLGPVAEELTFRGLLLRRANTFFRPAGAVVLSALLFSLCHLNLIQMIYTFPLGILFGILYVSSGSLLTPMLAHIALNAVTLILS